jgi:hypothetical protein
MSAHDAVITGATVTTARVTTGRTIVRITAPTIVRIMATEGILIIARTIGSYYRPYPYYGYGYGGPRFYGPGFSFGFGW